MAEAAVNSALRTLSSSLVIAQYSRVGSVFIEDTDVVGIESTRHELVDLLVKGKQERSVIAVLGEGGLGKTTLAGEISMNVAVKKHFDFQAWIAVGKEYIKEDLLRTIAQELHNLAGSAPGEIEKMEQNDPITTINEHLKDKCYMVVFDDVWKSKFWDDIEHALPENNKSSRIMFTTQNRDVADFVPSSIVKVHVLKPLPKCKARELFCRKTFGPDGCCPQNLKELSEKIIGICGGSPLAIVVAGGLLSTKHEKISEWKRLIDGLESKLGSDPRLKRCNRVLSEGYYDLPHHLKICLLYFALFPECYSISSGRLIRLWIAEGLVQYSKRLPSEQVAEEYLAELINRGLVQVSGRKVSGQVRSCRVHDLMYEIILRKTKEMDFYRVLKEEDLSHINDARRISAKGSTDSLLENIKDSKVRSIFIFDIDKLPDAFMTSFVANFKLLKVLDFEDGPVVYLPNEVGKLFHLHYLSVRNTKVKIIPKSIGKLLNLQTLDLRNTYVSQLPIQIRNLKKLRFVRVHVRENKLSSAVKIHGGIGSLLDLRKLDFVEAINSKVLKELRMLRQLRKLGIRLTSNGDVKYLFALINNLKYLEYLAVELTGEEEIVDMESLASPPQSLQYFYLNGNVKKLPNWISELKYLLRVWLALDGSIDDHLRVLQALPNLLELNLSGTHTDEQLHFKEDWFPELLALTLGELIRLESMMIEKGVMPKLRELTIGPCPLLKEIPIGIEHLRNLKTLIFFNMLKEIYCMIKKENWKVTEHILDIAVVCIKETYKELFRYTTKYLSSLSPEDIEQIILKNNSTKLSIKYLLE